MGTRLLVGEIEYLKVDRHTTNAATNFEGIDAFVDKVSEELRPCPLLLVGGIPDTRFTDSVVTARPRGGSVQETRGCRVEPWCQYFPVSVRRRAVATASASVTRRNRR
jgi:hypothetical protein